MQNLSIAVISIFMDNLPLSIPHYQRKVVSKFFGNRVHHYQILSSISHGEQIDRVLEKLTYDYYILLDIDAIPLSTEVLNWLVGSDEKSAVRGNMQRSNHTDGGQLFVAPSFMGFWRDTYLQCGMPSFIPSGNYDVGEAFCLTAQKKGISLDFLTPIEVIGELKWSLRTEKKEAGIGTTFGLDGQRMTFHNYEIRKRCNQQIFIEKCKSQLDPLENNYREATIKDRLLTRCVRYFRQ